MTAGPLLPVALTGVVAGGFVILISSLTDTFKPRFFAGLSARVAGPGPDEGRRR